MEVAAVVRDGGSRCGHREVASDGPGRPLDQPCGVRAFFLRFASLRFRFTLGFS
jgi:hypothetical protein